MGSVSRRVFLLSTASTPLVHALGRRARAAAETVIVGVMGTGGRGTQLARGFQGQAGCTVAYVCDADRNRVEQAAAAVERVSNTRPKVVTDFRRILDDKSVDALVIAAPDHWHAPATILACKAGKHVYVEKPCSHNPWEGEMMVAAARKYNRKVQMGNQRRSWPKVQEAMQALREGIIGRVYYSRGWYANRRGSIGRGKIADPPDYLDYELWQGPAPRRPYRTNVIHYNWHWFWHWGTGEIGNNGVHAIDLCRWGLQVDFPVHVTSAGGRYRFDDDQETPDTHVASYDFEGEKSIAWEGLSCNPFGIEHTGFGASFHGETGTLVITGAGYKVYDLRNRLIKEETGPGGDATHIANFLNAIRNDEPLNSEIAEGHKSTLLCHLGNIAYRVQRDLKCDPTNGHVVDDKEAMSYWKREYEPGWEPTLE